jgi:hypothetical protein
LAFPFVPELPVVPEFPVPPLAAKAMPLLVSPELSSPEFPFTVGTLGTGTAMLLTVKSAGSVFMVGPFTAVVSTLAVVYGWVGAAASPPGKNP